MEWEPIIIIFFFLQSHPCLSQQGNSYYYEKCAPYTCGGVPIAFPFTASETFCGLPGYDVACSNGSTPTITLAGGKPYEIKKIFRFDSLLTVSDTGLIDALASGGDCDSVRSHSLLGADFAPLQLPPSFNLSNLTSFVCPRDPPAGNPSPSTVMSYGNCKRGGAVLYFYRTIVDSEANRVGESFAAATCTRVDLPVDRVPFNNPTSGRDLLGVLKEGFPLYWPNQTRCWECEGRGGRCGHNRTTGEILCFCNDRCRDKSNQVPWKIIVAIGVPSVSIMLITAVVFLKFRERASMVFCACSTSQQGDDGGNDVDVKEFIKVYRSSLVTEYSYVDIKKMTDGFKEKLGRGGYGNVFKGKLPNNDHLVAIKVLEKYSGDNAGQDFVNEVATIGRIHHVNVIRLLGFCCDASQRALVYEFMPNGSLGNFIINSKEDLIREHHLGVPRMLQIAIGIAKGIEYLHQGCDTMILHLDIKPHNILLDANFNPKISDFGLAKLCSRRDSFVPLTGARGTIGYIAPEVFLRNLGGVSDKSDVYSYGMLLLEMVLGRKKMDTRVEKTDDNSSKAYFPNYVHDQLHRWRDEMKLITTSQVVEEDLYMSRKMAMVGLWCIQTNPISRPSISQVLEMLMGTIENIDMPPKPLLFSPPRLQHSGLGSSSLVSEGDTMYYTFED